MVLEIALLVRIMGAYPHSIPAPQPLSKLSSKINLVMLSFAKDPNHDGKFIPIEMWNLQVVTRNNIIADKVNKPGRKYLISIGGAADHGGTRHAGSTDIPGYRQCS